MTGGGALLARMTESFSERPARGQRRFALGGIEEDIMEKLLYTPVEAARVLGVGRSKVYELLGAGGVDVGAHRRLPPDFGARPAGVR